MNIKNLLGINAIGVPSVGKASAVTKPIRSENTQDRDANGQEAYTKQQKKKEKMTDEQFAKALGILKEKPFIKDMNWIVLAHEENGLKYAWVQDLAGATIRKISELDLWEVFDNSHDIPNKGQLLKKVA
ncbi:MAG: hypothetical protein WA160_00060 [Pseudobdellovibrio sp.]